MPATCRTQAKHHPLCLKKLTYLPDTGRGRLSARKIVSLPDCCQAVTLFLSGSCSRDKTSKEGLFRTNLKNRNKEPMKKLLNLTGLLGVLSLSALITGRGDKDNGANNNPPAVVALSQAQIQGQQLTLTAAGGQPQNYVLSVQGNNFTLYDSTGTNVVRTGSYVYNPANNTAVVTFTEQGATTGQVVNLTFTSATTSTYSTTG